MATVLYVLLQCGWGAIQTAVGLLVFLRYAPSPHSIFRGAVVTRWPSSYGLSLGLFLFVPREGEDPAADRRLLVHEYGHTLQSLLLGPLYLPVIGIPSLIWCRLPLLVRRRRQRGTPYSAFYTERWADRWGAGATGENSL